MQLLGKGGQNGAPGLPLSRRRGAVEHLGTGRDERVEQGLLLRCEFVEGMERKTSRRVEVPGGEGLHERVGQTRLVGPSVARAGSHRRLLEQGARFRAREMGRRRSVERCVADQHLSHRLDLEYLGHRVFN